MRPGSAARPWWVTGLQFAGIGWFIASAIVLGTLGGVWLDGRFGTAPLFILLGLALGLGTGFYGIYRMIVTFLVSPDGRNGKGPEA